MHLLGAGMASTHGLCGKKFDCILKGSCVVSAAHLAHSSFPLFERFLNIVKALITGNVPSALCRERLNLNMAEKYIPKPRSCLDKEASHSLWHTDKRPLCNVCSGV